jgi:dynein light intermediate chain 1
VGSSSLSLPGVERALLDRQQSDDGKSGKMPSSSRKDGHSTRERERERDRTRESGRATPDQRSAASAALQSPPMSSSDKSGGSRPTSPSGGTPKQSEVLHSFFQSLLKEKTPAPSRGSTSRAERKNAGQ